MTEIHRLKTGRALVTIDGKTRLVGAIDESDEKLVERFHQATRRVAPPSEPIIQAVKSFAHNPEDTLLKQARRAKLREIANEITAARDRGFGETDKYTPTKGLELGRFLDMILLYLLKELKDDDVVWVRNWWTGHQERLEVKTVIDSFRNLFPLRQSLLAHEQQWRDEVETIFNDTKITDEEKIKTIESLVIPKHLGLEEQDGAHVVARKLKRQRNTDGR